MDFSMRGVGEQLLLTLAAVAAIGGALFWLAMPETRGAAIDQRHGT